MPNSIHYFCVAWAVLYTNSMRMPSTPVPMATASIIGNFS